MGDRIVFRTLDRDCTPRFQARGYRERQVFSHRTYTIPKCGPDAAYLFREMAGDDTGATYWTLILHAADEALEGFPVDLFFDDDLIWHRQQYGQPGHVAYAIFAIQGDTLYGLNYVSDIVQRQSRQPVWRSRIQNRFNGWRHLLFNAVLNFAVENGIRTIRSPSAALVLQNTDKMRSPKEPLFERVYDRAIADFYDARRQDNWWVLDVAQNQDRIVEPKRTSETVGSRKRICLLHDIERGLGHTDSDWEFANRIEGPSDAYLTDMLAVEKDAGWRATYNVVGSLYEVVQSRIVAGNHCLAFHSFDHRIDDAGGQLPACRKVDYRVRGYRPPQSVLTPEITAKRLRRYNFDWLASSRSSLDIDRPVLRDQLIHIPVLFDDYPLHTGQMNYPTWEARALDTVEREQTVAFGLHDCYADHWLPYYERFLGKLSKLGEPCTLDDLSDQVFLSSCA